MHSRWLFWALLAAGVMTGCGPSPGPSAEAPVDALATHKALIARSEALIPGPPWPAGDERGMANAIGAGTWLRCAHHLSKPGARVYELSHLRSNDMPQTPWGRAAR